MHKRGRIMIALVFLVLGGHAPIFALDCPKMPEQVNKDWEFEVNVAIAKIGPVKGGELSTRTKNATKDLLGRLPDARKVYLEQMMYSAYCSALRDDKTIKEAEKAKLLREYNREVRRAMADVPVSPKAAVRPGGQSSNDYGADSKSMGPMNDRAKTPNLKIEVVGNTYVKGKDDVKHKVDLVYRNSGFSKTAIMSIELITKSGSIFRKIGEAEGVKLPLRIDERDVGTITFWLNKGDREQLADIRVTDMDDNKILTKQTWNAYVELTGIIMISSVGAAEVHVSQDVKVMKNKLEPVLGNKLSIFVKSIERAKSFNGFVVDATLSAPGQEEQTFSSIEKGHCLTYAGHTVRLISALPDSADFSVSDTPCR